MSIAIDLDRALHTHLPSGGYAWAKTSYTSA